MISRKIIIIPEASSRPTCFTVLEQYSYKCIRIFLLATRVHGLVHVVDPGPARRSARTRAAAPARGPAPARARTPRARAAGLAVAPAPARAPGIELLCKYFCIFLRFFIQKY